MSGYNRRTSSINSSLRQERSVTITNSAVTMTKQTSFVQQGSSSNTYFSTSRSPIKISPLSATSSNGPLLTRFNNSIRSDARSFLDPNLGVIQNSSRSPILRYDLRNDGYAIIFHHTFKDNPKLFRKGSSNDLKLIKSTLKNYRVKVVDPFEDFTVEKVKKTIAAIRNKNLAKYSCIIVIIMSHGGAKDFIRAKDQMYNFESHIVEPILMNSYLKDKPKLFFVQACKGNALMEPDVILTTTNKCDLLKCFSTYEGTVSLRNVNTGTYFIQSLFKMIEENDDKNITEIMMDIRKQFKASSIQQTPTEQSTLTKSFYFSDLKKKK